MSEQSKANGNEFAFPQNMVVDECGDLVTSSSYGSGLTKREFIAMNILSGWANECTDMNRPQHYKYAAESSVNLADALLEALENEQQ